MRLLPGLKNPDLVQSKVVLWKLKSASVFSSKAYFVAGGGSSAQLLHNECAGMLNEHSVVIFVARYPAADFQGFS